MGRHFIAGSMPLRTILAERFRWLAQDLPADATIKAGDTEQ
jgi:hypothetical protein